MIYSIYGINNSIKVCFLCSMAPNNHDLKYMQKSDLKLV